MNRPVYSALVRLLSPALLAWMAWRAHRSGGQWGVCSAPRFGFYGKAAAPRRPVWVHAVSLGETRAAQPLLRALLEQGDTVLLTHMTATGRAESTRVYADAIAQGRLHVQWLPYDFPGATQRFLRRYQPSAGVLIEREVWPNLLHAAQRQRVPMILASARFSDQSLRQSLRAGSVMREAYGRFAAVYAQTLQDAQRLEQAGSQSVRVSGNFKFDVSFPVERIQRGQAFARALGRRVVTVASTREGEDAPFIQAMVRQLHRLRTQSNELDTTVLFCLVPRHPERFDEAARQLEEAGLSFVRRSELVALGDASSPAIERCRQVDVLLGDTLGEMPWYYALSQVAIVAGSFEPLGGQNLIEPCAIGVPVLIGPHTYNFEQAAVDAVYEGAALRVARPEQALHTALQLLEEPQRMARMGQAGRDWVQKHAGAVARVLSALNDLRR